MTNVPPSNSSTVNFEKVLKALFYITCIVAMIEIPVAAIFKDNPVIKFSICYLGKSIVSEYCQPSPLPPPPTPTPTNDFKLGEAEKIAKEYYTYIHDRNCGKALALLSDEFKDYFQIYKENQLCSAWDKRRPEVLESAYYTGDKNSNKVGVFLKLKDNNTKAEYVRVELKKNDNSWKILQVKHLVTTQQ